MDGDAAAVTNPRTDPTPDERAIVEAATPGPWEWRTQVTDPATHDALRELVEAASTFDDWERFWRNHNDDKPFTMRDLTLRFAPLLTDLTTTREALAERDAEVVALRAVLGEARAVLMTKIGGNRDEGPDYTVVDAVAKIDALAPAERKDAHD